MRQSIRPGRTRKPRALDVERDDWGLYGPIHLFILLNLQLRRIVASLYQILPPLPTQKMCFEFGTLRDLSQRDILIGVLPT